MHQLGHHETLMRMPKISIECVLFVCGISSENLGLLMRSADIFSVSQIIYYQGNLSLDERRMNKLSRNSNVPISFVSDESILFELKSEGYSIIALEVTDNSIPLRDFVFSDKICLVIGHENDGICESILHKADAACHIEMTGGRISSLNVTVAASIAIYEIVRQNLNRIYSYSDSVASTG